MIIENRYLKDLQHLKSIANQGNGIIGLGSEGCTHKFIFVMEQFLHLLKEAQIDLSNKIRIVTPRIPEFATKDVMTKIQQALNLVQLDSIVINDYGLLWKLKNCELVNQVDIILGRTLVRSLEYTPWSKYILDDEQEKIQNSLLMPNIFHTSKLEFFRAFGVKGFELCPTPIVGKSIDRLHDEGFEVLVHYNTVIATIGRNCPVVRMLEADIGNCTNLCDLPLDITLTRVWGANQLMYTEPSEKATAMIPELKGLGNVIYYHPGTNDFPYTKCDQIIIDYRLIS